MKIKTKGESEIELGKVNPCPFCGSSKLKVTDKETFENLVNEHGSALINIECECSANLNLYNVPNENYYIGVGMIIERWNGRR